MTDYEPEDFRYIQLDNKHTFAVQRGTGRVRHWRHGEVKRDSVTNVEWSLLTALLEALDQIEMDQAVLASQAELLSLPIPKIDKGVAAALKVASEDAKRFLLSMPADTSHLPRDTLPR